MVTKRNYPPEPWERALRWWRESEPQVAEGRHEAATSDSKTLATGLSFGLKRPKPQSAIRLTPVQRYVLRNAGGCTLCRTYTLA